VNVVILAGGLGTRLAEETEVRPKPMIEVGGHPILWHIMKHYAHHGFKEFFVALGYKGEAIKRYFMDYYSLNGSISFDLASGEIKRQDQECEDWIVHLKNTGLRTNTGGRVLRLRPWLEGSTFMVTYGDGVSNVDLQELLKFHRSHGRIGTVTAVRPPARFGGLIFDNRSMVTAFTEKPQIGEGWINGGFLVFEPGVFDYLEDDQSSLESDALESLAANNQLAAYPHTDFWQCMDTLRDKQFLEREWQSDRASWKVWD